MQIRSSRCLFGAVFLCACLATEGRCTAETNPPSPTLEGYLKMLGYYPVSLQRHGGLSPSVDVQIGAGRHRFGVDTGCTITTVDKKVGTGWSSLKNLGSVLEDSVFGRWTNDCLVVIPDMQIGAARFTNQPAYLEKFSAALTDGGVVGILGVDFMLRSHGLLDCIGPRLFVRSSALTPGSRANLGRTMEGSGFKQVRLKRCLGLGLACDAMLNGHPVTLLLDSGAFWTILDVRVANRLRLSTVSMRMELRGLQKQREPLKAARLRSLELDGVPVSTATKSFGVADLASWKITPEQPGKDTRAVDGLIGSDLLILCHALIDPAGGCMWVLPDKRKSGHPPSGS